MLELKRLSVDDGLDIYTMLQEIPAEENGLINKANGLTFDEYKEWLIVKQRDSEQEGIVDGWKVPSTTFWLYADGIPVGFGSVRHFLTEALRKAGGNIGYGIAPAFRGKGYGKELLRLLLNEAKEMGIDKVLVTILLDNIASQKELTREFSFGLIASINKSTRGSAGRKCPHTASKPLRIHKVFSAAFSLSASISAPAELLRIGQPWIFEGFLFFWTQAGCRPPRTKGQKAPKRLAVRRVCSC